MTPIPAQPIQEEGSVSNELVRLCLPNALKDPDRSLAWLNSICALFLLVGLMGSQWSRIDIPPVPVLPQAVPVVEEPANLAPEAAAAPKMDNVLPQALPSVPVVVPNLPELHFSVPTIGVLASPSTLAAAPVIEPLQTATQIGSVGSTGAGGDRPMPPYPSMALEDGDQGTVILMIVGDGSGAVGSVQVAQSSGYPLLDSSTVDYVRRHWRLPSGPSGQKFQTRITYKLQMN